MRDYSQNGEQAIILKFFENHGIIDNFLDIGAFNGVDMSNTMGLVKSGWCGVCLEPSKLAFEALQNTHRDKSHIRCMNLALAKDTGTILLYDAGGDGASTTVEKLKTQWENGACAKFTEVQAQSISAKDLLKDVGEYHDFVNIDTEWTSAENLFRLLEAGLDFNLLCVEHDDDPQGIIAKLPDGIVVHAQNSVNLFLEDRRA